MAPDPASEIAQLSRLRRFLLTVATASSLVLIPWVVYLAMSLPNRHVADQWNVAWVGFDLALVVMLGWTAWNAWHRRRMVVLSAVVTATLLVCDAWFDIVLDWGTRHLAVSVATAVLAELPLAALLLRVAVRGIQAMQQGHWRDPKPAAEASRMRRLSVRELVRRGQPNDE